MKVPVTFHIMLNDDTRQTCDGEIEVTVSADQIAAAIGESKGMETMHILTAVNNMGGFFKDIPDATLMQIQPSQRLVIAQWLRTTANRFAADPQQTNAKETPA